MIRRAGTILTKGSGEPATRQLNTQSLDQGEPYQVTDDVWHPGPPIVEHVRSIMSLEKSAGEVARLHHHRKNNASASDAAAFMTLRGAAAKPQRAFPAQQQQQPQQNVHLNSTDGLVVVSVFLPVILQQNGSSWSADWDYEVLLSMQTHLRVTRIGVVKQPVKKSERRAVEELLSRMQCVPVWVDPPETFAEMYNGFCKGVLWPVLHNVTSVYSHRPDDNTQTARNTANADGTQFSEYSMEDVEHGPIHGGRGREADLWRAYNNVNRLFAETVVQCFHEGDLVWIHGFHLLILPSYLARRLPMAKVGIFLHTPFPSSEIFRTLWCREDLLRGMLNADQVGFHLFEYARHFLTCCRRLLGWNYGMIPDAAGGHTLAIDTNGRNVTVTSIHAGVEPSILNQILTHTVDTVKSIRNRVSGRHICCGVDRLESLKGIPLKLLGLERFLMRCPEWVGRIVLVQVGITAHERGDDYIQTQQEVIRLVEKINNQWPGTVEFQECAESDMKLQQRMAILRAADTVVVTAIRDGLNLLPLEFTIAHQDAMTELGQKDMRKRGLCILSEFSSCTRVMRGALHVNPWKISEIANAFHQAVSMSEDERLRRISIASEFVTRVTTQRWALAVMLDLKGVQKSVNKVQYSGVGLGLNYHLLGMDTGFNSLDTTMVAKAYRKSFARLIFVDYGGTIVRNDNVRMNATCRRMLLTFHLFQLNNLTRFKMVKERHAKSVPTESMIKTLRGLCEDKRNTVFVVSGKECHSLTETLGSIPNLGLAAEHGMFISWPTPKAGSKRRWDTLVPQMDRTWRNLAVTIMEVYTSRTHGSYIEQTEMKVLWQYRDADTEFGSLQAKELEDHLEKYLRGYSVDILHGGIEEGGFVEVRPKGVNKGVLALHVLRRYPDIAQKERVDFALVLGDDHCDEPMLSVMRQIGRRVTGFRRAANGEDPLPAMPTTSIQRVDVSMCDNFVSADLEVFTATVGKKPSAAANYLHDVETVQELLDGLVKMSTRELRFHSSINLSTYSTEELTRLVSESRDEAGSNVRRTMSLSQIHSSQNGPSLPAKVPDTLNGFFEELVEEDEEDDGMFF